MLGGEERTKVSTSNAKRRHAVPHRVASPAHRFTLGHWTLPPNDQRSHPTICTGDFFLPRFIKRVFALLWLLSIASCSPPQSAVPGGSEAGADNQRRNDPPAQREQGVASEVPGVALEPKPDVTAKRGPDVAAELTRRLATLRTTDVSDPAWQRLEKDLRRALTDQPGSTSLLGLAAEMKAASDPAMAAEWLLDAIPEEVAIAEAGSISAAGESPKHAELLQLVVQLAATAQRDDLAWRAMKRMLEHSPGDPLIGRASARLLNRLGYRHEANEILRSLLPSQPLVIEELMGLINPLRTYRAFESRPDLDDASFVVSSGPLSVARAMRTRGDIDGALRCLRTYANPESDPAVAAFLGYLLTNSATLEDFRRWLTACPSGAEDHPEYWLAIGNAANRYGEIGWEVAAGEMPSSPSETIVPQWPKEAQAFSNDAGFVAFQVAWQLEPGCTEAVQGLIASCERLVGAGNARQNQSESQTDSQPADDFLDRLRDRMIAMDETRWLAVKLIESIGQQKGFDPRMVERLTGQLVSVGRPLEGLGWQEAIVGGMAPGDRMLAEIARKKQQVELERYRTRRFLGLHHERPAKAWSVRLAVSIPTTGDPAAAVPSIRPPWTNPSIVPVVENVAEELGLNFRYENVSRRAAVDGSIDKHFRLFEAMGGGIVCLDYDLDGGVDLLLGQGGYVRGEHEGSPWPPKDHPADSLLAWRDDGFVDVATRCGLIDSGYTIGLSAADLNADGFDDLLIGNVGPNACWINQGDGTFRRQTGFDGQTMTVTTVLAAADLTGDALPDVIEVNYVDDANVFRPVEKGSDGKPVSLPGPLHYRSGVHRVWRSSPGGMDATFAEAEPLGVDAGEPLRSTGLGLVVSNFDLRANNELFIASDQMANQFWTWDQDGSSWPSGSDRTGEPSRTPKGQWMESAAARGLAFGVGGKPLACMGIATADFDHNGLADFHVTNYFDEWSNHYLQQSPGQFRDDAGPLNVSELSRQVVGFGCQSLDYDHNGTEDLWVLNGHIEDFRDQGKPFRMPAQIYSAEGERYVEMAQRSTDASTRRWFAQPQLGRALARLDFDRDGDLDALAGELTEPYSLLENRTDKAGGSLLIELVGVRSSRDAVGACVTVTGDQGVVRRWRVTGDGFACRNEPVLHFGLGSMRTIRRIDVQWPSGVEQTIALEPDLGSFPANQSRRCLIVEGQPDPWLRR